MAEFEPALFDRLMHKAPAKWTTEERVFLQLNKDFLWELFMTIARESMKEQIDLGIKASNTKPKVEITISFKERAVHDEQGNGYTLGSLNETKQEEGVKMTTTTHYFEVCTNLKANGAVKAAVDQFTECPMACPDPT
ncbi:MAG: hypothetical protein AAFP20_25405 [Cyanobacteria bacterium J06614_10]